MKNLIMLIMFLSIANTAIFAQDDSKEESKPEYTDTTTIKLKNTEVIIKYNDKDKDKRDISIEPGKRDNEEVDISIRNGNDVDDEITVMHHKKYKKVKTRWLMLDMGISSYMHDQSLNLPDSMSDLEQNLGRSINVNLWAFKQRVSLIQGYANLKYGLSFNFHNYALNNDVTLLPNTDSLEIIPSETSLKRNKLATTYMEFPMMLNFETNPKKTSKSFRVGAGAYAGLLLSARTKQKSDALGKVKLKDDFNMSKYRFGLVGEIGMGPITFYANYALTPLFIEGNGPELNAFNFGISIIGF